MTNTCTMTTGDVLTSRKSGVKAPLKGEFTVKGVPVNVTMMVKADGEDVLALLGISDIGDLVDIVFKESAQQTL